MIPEIYRIGENDRYVYPNDKTTNFSTKSAFLGKEIDFNKLNDKIIENCKYNEVLGLYFGVKI